MIKEFLIYLKSLCLRKISPTKKYREELYAFQKRPPWYVEGLPQDCSSLCQSTCQTIQLPFPSCVSNRFLSFVVRVESFFLLTHKSKKVKGEIQGEEKNKRGNKKVECLEIRLIKSDNGKEKKGGVTYTFCSL